MPSPTLNTVQAYSVSVLRGGRGLFARQNVKTATEPLELFEFEGCPYCRKVRDVLSELDLEYVSRSCGKGSAKREIVRSETGKEQFPYLRDPNTGAKMLESEAIIDYLYETYGTKRSAAARILSPANTISSALATVVRPTRGVKAKTKRSVQPEKELILYNFEASPYCRKVREVLVELDLDVHVKNVAKNSARRPELRELGGRMMVPYLVDPNTGTQMYESLDIIDYLKKTYG